MKSTKQAKSLKENPEAFKQEQSPAPPDHPDILSMAEAAEMLKTTRQTLYGWLRSGSLRAVKTGRQWRFERSEIERFLKGQEPKIELRADIRPLLDHLKNQADQANASPVSLPEENDLQRVISQIVRLGVGLGASHIHIHPNQGEDGIARSAVLRYRVDGVLRPAAEIDMRLLPPLMEQWKVLASLDPKETHRQQERALRVKYDGQAIEMQCQFSSSALGEALTVGNLRPHAGLTLSQLGFSETVEQKIRRAIESPWGLVVFASPSSSGRTTTVYSCLSHLSGPDRKIVTIEDRVERTFPWMVQLALHVNVATSFPFALRHFMRSDAEVIMVDYMPDRETIESAQFAALSGRLVLAGLFAADAAGALTRMAEMGAPAHDIAEATRLVMSQRLVRRLCEKCSQAEEISGAAREQVERLLHDGGATVQDRPMAFRKPVGCDHCRGTGYKGRTAVAEALEITPEIREALKRHARSQEIKSIAISQGMVTLTADALTRAARGETSLDEVKRVVGLG